MAGGAQGDIELQARLSRTVLSDYYYHALNETAYSVNEELTNSATGDTAAVEFTNPADSGHTAIFPVVHPSARAPSTARVYDEFSSGPSGGDTVEIGNALSDSGNNSGGDSVLNCTANSSFTETNRDATDQIGGGSGGQASGGGADMPAMFIEPGRTHVVEVEKVETDGDNVSITARWFEVPVVFSEETPDFEMDELYR